MDNEKRERRIGQIKQGLFIAVGVLMIACGIHFFLLPNNLSLGGATGMALVLSKYLPLSTGPLLVIVNAVLFILGFLIIGNKFGILTVISSLALSGTVWFLEAFLPIQEPVVHNIFLNLIIAVLLYGSGVGIVLNQYASTGGSDIIAKIINRFFGLDLGKGCLVTDFVITLFAGFTFGTEVALYCIIGVIINGLVIDFTIDGMNGGKLCFITTTHPDEICDYLISLGRSATIYDARGAYTREPKTVIQTVVSNRDFIRLKGYIKMVDESVFMVVTNSHKVIGWHWRKLDD
ncbi:MAG: YitT family protein [Tissierellia bacterium]|nr:YitT family protein [Tissierellia bacterium]